MAARLLLLSSTVAAVDVRVVDHKHVQRIVHRDHVVVVVDIQIVKNRVPVGARGQSIRLVILHSTIPIIQIS